MTLLTKSQWEIHFDAIAKAYKSVRVQEENAYIYMTQSSLMLRLTMLRTHQEFTSRNIRYFRIWALVKAKHEYIGDHKLNIYH